MSRIVSALRPGIEQDECKAAVSVKDLAELIQDLCYYKDADGIAPATVKAMHRAYRVLKPVAEFYCDDSVLVWDAPDTKFRKVAKC